MLRRKNEMKIKDALGEDQFECGRGKGTTKITGMLRRMSGRTWDTSALHFTALKVTSPLRTSSTGRCRGHFGYTLKIVCLLHRVAEGI